MSHEMLVMVLTSALAIWAGTTWMLFGMLVLAMVDRAWWGSVEVLYGQSYLRVIPAVALWPLAALLAIAVHRTGKHRRPQATRLSDIHACRRRLAYRHRSHSL